MYNALYMEAILPYIQVLLAILLIILVLLQRSEAGLGSAFGGGNSMSSINYTRRGFEKTLFNATIVVSILFVISVFAAVLL